MRSYRVSTIFTQRELIEFLEHNTNLDVTVQIVPDPPGTEVDRSSQSAPDPIYTPERGPRRQRKSKVINAILARLGEGEAEVSDLRQAVERAGMSPSSLSTGLAILQKIGQIKRNSNGNYYLVVQEAAE